MVEDEVDDDEYVIALVTYYNKVLIILQYELDEVDVEQEPLEQAEAIVLSEI